LAALLVLVLSGCGSQLLGPGEQRELEAAQARWEAAALPSYAFDYRRICFCVDGGRLVRITVQAGEVSSVTAADTQGPLADPSAGSWPTVAQLFTRLEGHAEGGSRDGWTLDVEYDATLGYPTEIKLVAPENIADGGSTERVTGLTAT